MLRQRRPLPPAGDAPEEEAQWESFLVELMEDTSEAAGSSSISGTTTSTQHGGGDVCFTNAADKASLQGREGATLPPSLASDSVFLRSGGLVAPSSSSATAGCNVGGIIRPPAGVHAPQQLPRLPRLHEAAAFSAACQWGDTGDAADFLPMPLPPRPIPDSDPQVPSSTGLCSLTLSSDGEKAAAVLGQQPQQQLSAHACYNDGGHQQRRGQQLQQLQQQPAHLEPQRPRLHQNAEFSPMAVWAGTTAEDDAPDFLSLLPVAPVLLPPYPAPNNGPEWGGPASPPVSLQPPLPSSCQQLQEGVPREVEPCVWGTASTGSFSGGGGSAAMSFTAAAAAAASVHTDVSATTSTGACNLEALLDDMERLARSLQVWGSKYEQRAGRPRLHASLLSTF